MSKNIKVSALCMSFVLAASCPPALANSSKLMPAGTLQASASAGVMDSLNHDVVRGAGTFINSLSQQALSFLVDENITAEEKRASFSALLESSFDLRTISRFALGRYWRAATPEQRQEYERLFTRMILNVYSDKFDEYQGQNFAVQNVRAEGRRDTIVTSFILPENGPEVRVDWRVRYKKGRYKVIDVMVEGISMTVTQRSDFAAVIQRGGGSIAPLLEHLRQY